MPRQILRAALCLATIAIASPITLAQTAPAQTPAQTPMADQPFSSLPAQIATLLADPAVARDHWGIMVTSLDGAQIFALNEAQLFQPASNTKLYTTSTAMALLGPERRLETRVTGALDPAGIVKGDLTLIGVGDANLDSEDLPYVPPAARPKPADGQPVPHQPNPMHDIQDLVAQLAAKGVKQIKGDIIGDDTLFPWNPYPQDWSIDDAVWGYGAPISALTISDNELRLSIAPAAAAGQPAVVTLEQAAPYYTVQADVGTVATKEEATGVQITRTIGSRILHVYGSIALKDETDVEHVAIEDPAEFAAMALRASLIEHGIAVTGIARAKHRPVTDAAGFLTTVRRSAAEDQTVVTGGIEVGSCLMDAPLHGVTTLATHKSDSLAADVTYTNKVSQNLHAELLLKSLARRSGCAKGSTAEGARLIRAYLLHAGIDPDDFIFFDGSGLSGHDLTTPRATARLLSFATTQPWFAAWKSSLPIGGEDGSLASRFAQPPLKDHVIAKTGTLSEARALSGYLDAASGRTVIFSIMVGNHLPGTDVDRVVMDKIVAAIQAAE
jgi:D-alanyl-D-alanine carboxypeptidase/D-alanyl-D-alanine-endopeptidase (penicillin-binding protein 4)